MNDVRKGIYILPNLFTSASLFCGFYAIIEALRLAIMQGTNFDRCAMAIVVAAFFDGMDGRVARKTGTASRFGVEFDSLADLVSFGVAPAVVVWLWALRDFDRWGWFASFIYLACGALRLARFNVQATSLEKKFFQGLPIPMAALMVAGSILIWEGGAPHAIKALSALDVRFILMLLVTLLALLMVSTIPYRSFKTMNLTRRVPFYFLFLILIGLTLWASRPKWVIYFLGCAYVLSGPLEKYVLTPPVRAFQKVKKLRRSTDLNQGAPSTPNQSEENVTPIRRM
jgi:CDP-diacylglycerol--serine O-phosphatidyltransferase